LYLVDTDTASLFLWGHPRITARVLATPPDQVWLSAIAVEEMLDGARAVINRERGKGRSGLEKAYSDLDKVIKHIARFNVLPYSNEADALFKSWPSKVKRVGEKDCRTAALAITRNMIVVTCNAKDFSAIPGCRFEDWSR
jgi:predicted nucleic acid-binding protein